MNIKKALSKNLYVTIHKNKKIYHAIYWAIVVSLSFMLLVTFLKTRYYHVATDGLYYYSIAKNLHDNGVFKDLVINSNVFTPQNGVVFLQFVLMKFGLVKDQVFDAIALIHYAGLLSTLFPLLAIMRFIGIRSWLAAYSIVAYCLCCWPFLSVLLFPQNEGLFFSGFIWLIYLLVSIYRFKYDSVDYSKIRYKIYLGLCVAISILIIHFRVNMIFVPVAGIGAGLLFKKFKIIPFLFLLSVVMISSLLIPYHFIENDISEFSDNKIIYLLSDFKDTILDFCFHAIPASIFRDFKSMQSNIIYLAVLLSLLTAFISSLKQKNYLKIQILLFCFMTYGLILTFGIFNIRYMIVIVPLVFILMLDSIHFRNIAYLFIFACVSTSLWAYYDGIKVPFYFKFWSELPSEVNFEGENPMLIAGKPRSCWYFTGISPQFVQKQWEIWTVHLPKNQRHGSITYEHVKLFTWEELLIKENIYILGHEDFVDYQTKLMGEMALKNNFHVQVKEIVSLHKHHLVNQIYLKKAGD